LAGILLSLPQKDYMKLALQLRIGQHLTMTPQLQQAIRLLQLSTIELEAEVQNALESNPMLEQDEDSQQQQEAVNDAAVENRVDTGPPASEVIPDELPVDSSWDDIFDTGTTSYSAPDPTDQRDPVDAVTVTGDLHDHLYWQLELTHLSDTDRAIAYAIIDAINEDGHLTVSTEEIFTSLSEQLEIELDEVDAVLHRIQQFDPIGVGARDLRESLLIQLEQFTADTPWLNEAKQLVRDFIKFLGNKDYNLICRNMKLGKEDLKKVLSLIQTLNPRPGASFNNERPEYIVPDVFVRKHNGKWRVELNNDSLPKLRINQFYANMVKRGNNSKDNIYLKDNLQEARWFLKSLQSRHDTLLKVANSIVERQRAFLEFGDEAMKPMILKSIAEEIEMHESTISRVTTRKYIHTPRGIFELKFFFSSHVSTESGGECSATAIRAIIRKLVAAENPVKPLSDNKMAGILAGQGINVARRTIAKYRESLSISPSNERKRLE
jgi:RNA polymerase sigma-54 factor